MQLAMLGPPFTAPTLFQHMAGRKTQCRISVTLTAVPQRVPLAKRRTETHGFLTSTQRARPCRGRSADAAYRRRNPRRGPHPAVARTATDASAGGVPEVESDF